ncbi:MAG TPA: efflux RND transporter permease subunit [Caulobacteraceae bacterium]|jgi:CzcA family heavy metal efflux pump
MLGRLIHWCLKQAWVVVLAGLVLTAGGLWWVRDLPVEVFPALTPAQTVVQAEAPGLVAEQVEQLVTRPIENVLGGVPGVARIRSESVQGLSVVTLEFAADAKPGPIRQAVVERLGEVEGALPPGVAAPRIAPFTAATGEVLKLGFTSKTLDPMALRNLIQWTVRPRLLATAGVANVALYGGQVRRVEVRARPSDLSDSDLGFADVIAAVRRATSVTGAGFMDTPSQRIVIDPRGQALKAEDVANAQIQTPGNAPVHLGDVADVVDAPAPATGDALIMGRPGVLAEISAVNGAGTLDTTRAVERTLEVLRPTLAAQGVTITADLDRPADFITGSLQTLGLNLAIGAGLIAICLVLAFRDLRAAILCLVTIPLSLVAAMAAMKLAGLTLNAMTLGGLFVGLGVAIDDVVLDAENIVGRLREAEPEHHSRIHAVHHALMDVRAPVFYATMMVVLALVPMLLAGGAFGALAGPLAFSVAAAALASLVVSATFTPALAILLLHDLKAGREPAYLRRARAAYATLVRRMCGWRAPALAVLVLAVLAASLALALLPRAPLPDFHDRRLVVDVRAPPATSPEAMRRITASLTATALRISGVRRAVEHSGRDPTDFSAAAIDQAQLELALDPKLDAAGQDRVAAALNRAFQGYPDVKVTIRHRLALGTGAASAFSVNVYGENLDAVDRAAGQVADALRTMGGAQAVTSDAAPLAPAMRIDLDFKRLALYGLGAADVLDTVQAALQGMTVAHIYDSGRAIDLTVTGPEALRRDPEAIDNLLLRSSSGVSVPLRLVANVYLTQSRSEIQHEAGQRLQVVSASPKGDPRRFAAKARDYLQNHVTLPPGVYLTFDTPAAGGGTRTTTLLVLGGLALLAMVGLLTVVLKDGRLAWLVLLSTAFSFVGGVAAVLLMGGAVSLGELAGFIALFGLSTRASVLLVTRPHEVHARKDGSWTLHTMAAAAGHRVAAILAGAILVALSVAPLLFTRAQAGGEVLGPMAAVIIGGLASGAVLSLLFLPPLILGYSRPRDAIG